MSVMAEVQELLRDIVAEGVALDKAPALHRRAAALLAKVGEEHGAVVQLRAEFEQRGSELEGLKAQLADIETRRAAGACAQECVLVQRLERALEEQQKGNEAVLARLRAAEAKLNELTKRSE